MSKKCFVISIIGEKASEERRYADTILRGIIIPAASSAGYQEADVIRADQIDDSGMITAQIVEAIQKSDLVIADLTYPNPNVYYEIGIRHCTGRPIVHLLRDGAVAPFDVAQLRNIRFGTDVLEAESARADLMKKIKAAEDQQGPSLNPVTQAAQVEQIRSSTIPSAEILAKILEGQIKMENDLSALRKRLEHRPEISSEFLSDSEKYTNALNFLANSSKHKWIPNRNALESFKQPSSVKQSEVKDGKDAKEGGIPSDESK